jgi:MFS family permease
MKKTFYYGYVIVFVIFILQIVMFGPRSSFGVFIVPISEDMVWPRALIAGVFSVSTLVQSFSSIFMGWLNDRLGPRFVLTVCGIVVGCGLILVSTVQSAWQLYLFYVALVGVGMGSLVAPQMSTIARWFVKRRNIMTALLLAGGGIGGLVGPPLITWIIYTYSWRQAFFFVGIGVSVIIVLSAQFLKRDPSKIGLRPYGEVEAKEQKAHSDTFGLTWKEAYKTARFWLFVFILFCVGFCLWTVMIHMVPCAIDQGITPATAAVVLSAMNGAQVIGSICIGLIADRVGSRRLMLVSVCLLAFVIFLMLPFTSVLLLSVYVMLVAIGLGGVSVVQSSMTAELFGMKSHGILLGSTVFTFSLGGAVGTYVGGSIFDLTGSYQIVFLLCGILMFAAIIVTIFLNRIRKNLEIAKAGSRSI